MKIIDLDTACSKKNKNVFIKFLNFLFKPVLKIKIII